MTLTKAQVRSAVREYIDDVAAKKWTDPNLDILIKMIHDGLWGDILDIAPYLNSKYQQIVSPLHVPGYVDIRATGDGGDLVERMYRIQQVIINGRHYFPKDPRDYLMSASTNTGDVTTVTATVEQLYSYQILGDQMWIHPLGTSVNVGFMELRYSFRPTQFTSLADGTAVGFPDGTEHALILAAASYALARADQEDPTRLLQLAAVEREHLYSTIRRRYHGMTVPFSMNSQAEMGGS